MSSVIRRDQTQLSDKIMSVYNLHPLTKRSRVLLEKLIDAQLRRDAQNSIDPDGSLPCSQQPAANTNPQQDETDPQYSIMSDPFYRCRTIYI
jgi:hypothetical protein